MIEFKDSANFEYCFKPSVLTMVELNGPSIRLHLKCEVIRIDFESEEESRKQYEIIKEAMNNEKA